jgi:hypothetical protein
MPELRIDGVDVVALVDVAMLDQFLEGGVKSRGGWYSTSRVESFADAWTSSASRWARSPRRMTSTPVRVRT